MVGQTLKKKKTTMGEKTKHPSKTAVKNDRGP